MHGMYSKSRTQVLSYCYLHNVYSVVDSLYQDVESISELDFEGIDNPIGLNGLHFKLVYPNDTSYEG